MGYYTTIGPCAACGVLFSFNAQRVPSVRVRGVREPVCASCLATWNARRVAAGLDAIPALEGAYDPSDERDWIDDSD
jgi:hypothetical protein